MMAPEKKLPMIPRNDLVLVEMDDAPEKTKGGILLLTGTGKYARKGTVRAVGPGAFCAAGPAGVRLPMDLKEGDRVFLADDRYRAEVDDGEDKWALIPQHMIGATLPPASLLAVP